MGQLLADRSEQQAAEAADSAARRPRRGRRPGRRRAGRRRPSRPTSTRSTGTSGDPACGRIDHLVEEAAGCVLERREVHRGRRERHRIGGVPRVHGRQRSHLAPGRRRGPSGAHGPSLRPVDAGDDPLVGTRRLRCRIVRRSHARWRSGRTRAGGMPGSPNRASAPAARPAREAPRRAGRRRGRRPAAPWRAGRTPPPAGPRPAASPPRVSATVAARAAAASAGP